MPVRWTPTAIRAAFATTLVWLGLTSAVSAGWPYLHYQRAPVRCCAPQTNFGVPGYNYGHDRPRFADTALAIADADQPAKLYDASGVQRKPFHFTKAALTANHVRLEQVGLSIYDSGSIAASGKITHSGGPDGSLLGNQVTIRLRAYAAPVDQQGQLPINSSLVWQSEHKLWVPRGSPQSVVLTDRKLSAAGELRRYFGEITHLEVELSYQQDR